MKPLGGDTEANDGIYSAYFLDFESNSARYGLSVTAQGTSESLISVNDVVGITS